MSDIEIYTLAIAVAMVNMVVACLPRLKETIAFPTMVQIRYRCEINKYGQ